MLNKFVVVDLETTGNSPKKGDKIIQLAAVVIENGKITETFTSLLNPNQAIPVFIEELTGLSFEMVKDAPLFSQIAAKVMALLEDAYFVAHNVLFDLSFLQEELIQAGYEGFYGPIVDTVELARILFPTADGYKLSDLAGQENLRHDRPHQADSDAEVTAELLLILLEKLKTLPQKTLQQLVPLAGGLKSDLQQLFEELFMGKEKTVEELPKSIEIFNGLAIRRSHPKPAVRLMGQDCQYPFDEKDKVAMLQRAFQSYEKRKGQFSMMDEVFLSFQNGSHTLIEAGTGVGKSLGYLLPAAFFSRQAGIPIVVSTYTIQLQEQLIRKEIPQLSKMVPFEVKAVLLKGRNHYISLEKFSQNLMDQNDNYDTTLTKMQILVWLLETETGDKDELNLSSGGQIFWNKIKNDYPAEEQKSVFEEKDFYARAKRNAESADIIITNHSLLLSDIVGKSSIIPDYQYAVIDEGHNLEKAAAKYMGQTLDYLTIRLLLGQLGLYEQKQLFYNIERIVEDSAAKVAHCAPRFELNQLISDLLYEMDDFFKLIAMFIQRNSRNKKNTNRLKMRFYGQKNNKESLAIIHSAERFAFLLKDVHFHFNERLVQIRKVVKDLSEEQISIMNEMISFLGEIKELRDAVNEIMLKDSMLVKWFEVDLRSPQNTTTVFAQPASVADFLKASLFDEKKSIVITSATLTVNHSYGFIKHELGLSEAGVLTIPSPFDYKKQVQLLISEDLPEINAVSVDDYVVEITEQIITIAEATKGRMLLLFTAHEMLKKTYELIKESGFLADFAIIAQGITSGSQTRLTRNFQRYEKAILLGTSSFWEGIDIPGEDLSCLVIVRLPFSPPDDPYTEAKCEYVTRQGGNAFYNFSLPEAVIRFKQGFGRLIRTESDRGVMVIFDKRIISTKYGKAFLKSIPEIDIKNGSIDEIVESIHQWL